MKISQNLKQNQLQKLAMTQQMQQSIRILKASTEELTSMVKDRALDNPFIKVQEHVRSNLNTIDFSDLASNPGPSLDEYLLEQVHLTMRDTPIRTLVVYFIENLDDNGYLNLDLDQLHNENKVDSNLIADALTLLHQLDPPGIGARNLQECLFIQADLDKSAPHYATDILHNHFNWLVNRQWNSIISEYGVTKEDATRILKYVQTLSPAPGLGYHHTKNEYIYPDLEVKVNNCIPVVRLTKENLPQISFKKNYYEKMDKANDPTVKKYINQKKQDFEQLLSQIQQRERTILLVGRTIIEHQIEFFSKSNHPLKPLLLRDIAHQLQLHESTISRAVNGKYLKTDFGTFELKSFFTSAANYATDQSLSTDTVQQLIQQLISKEDHSHPLSDQKIVELLEKRNINISRRTVAKYRLQLGILSSSKRKSGY